MADSQDTIGAAPAMSDLVQIDEICDRYEEALKAGEPPNLTAVLVDVPQRARTALLGELLLIEIYHGRSPNELVRSIKYLHPELAEELDAAVARVEHRISTRASPDVPTHASDVVLASESLMSASRAIEIVCPRCGNSVTVQSDARSSKVFCQACQSTFNLAEDVTETRGAAALKTLGHFRLTARLGVGGCGTVWKAHDTKLDRTVAIKIPHSGRLDREEQLRFLREARAVARLVHPNIVSVHEIGDDGELDYIVSDFVRGVSLSDWLTGKRMSAREAAELLAKVADALHYAHEQGIIHRDIKPSNIMMDAVGEPHITDFGLAKWEAADFSIAVDRQVMGTPAYMSPEQARGEAHQSDRRTDVYALGVVLFQLLTGELPFRGNQEMLLHQIKYDAPPSPRKLDKNIPQDLETICLKCLDKPLASRYESAKALSDDLRRYLRGEPIRARPVSLLVRGVRWCRRKPAAAAAIALLVLIAIAGPVAAAYQAELRWKAKLAAQVADRARREAQTLVQELMGMRSAAAPGAANRSAVQFRLPLVSDRLAASALENGLTILRKSDAAEVSDEKMAKLQIAVGMLSARQGRFEAAVEHLRHAHDTLSRLRASAPAALRYGAGVAFCQECLGQIYAAMGDTGNALRHQSQAVREWQRVAREYPNKASFKKDQAESLLRLSLSQSLAGRGGIALANVKQSKMLVDEVADLWTDSPDLLYLRACELAECPPILAEDWLELRQVEQ